MIQSATIPGLGLPWPESWKALMRHYITRKAASKAIGISPSGADYYCSGKSKPRLPRVRQAFLDYGWTTYELPVVAPRAQEKYTPTDEDKARHALCRLIWRRNPQMHWAERFVYAVVESAKADIEDPTLLLRGYGGRKERRTALLDDIYGQDEPPVPDTEPWVPEAILEIEAEKKL